jgi:agmatine deiminase
MSQLLMPAEWELHAATWLAWPHKRTDWPKRFSPIRWVYTEIIRALTRHESVNLVVRGPKMRDAVQPRLTMAGVDLERVRIFELPTDRSWVRDSGPIFVKERSSLGVRASSPATDPGRSEKTMEAHTATANVVGAAAGEDARAPRIALDWRFNAWAKYDDWKQDDLLPAFVARQLGVPAVRPVHHGHRVVLEGGSIDVNGQGLLLTTEECLLSKVQERNPPFGRADYETVFAQYLGIKQVIWLNKGITGDDTHGHVDDLARFVNPTTVVAGDEKNPADANYTPLQENLERLRAISGLTVVSLPMPAPIVFDGMRLPASYANFYIANGVVIVPTFNDPADRNALGILADLFPDREVVGIHCGDLIWGLGTLHCMTQQEPQ